MARSSRGRRRGPTDPQVIALRRAEARERERQAERDPAQWGIQAEILKLPANDAVAVTKDPYRRGRIAHARRCDPFDALYNARGPDGKRGLSQEQHQAAQRYFRDWAQRAGARLGASTSAELMTVIDSDKHGPLDGGMTMARIAAGARIDRLHMGIGPVDAMLGAALVEPLAHGVETIPWRTVVAAVTGERDKHAQAARVRGMCENMRLVYQAIDQARPPRRDRR